MHCAIPLACCVLALLATSLLTRSCLLQCDRCTQMVNLEERTQSATLATSRCPPCRQPLAAPAAAGIA